MNYENQFKRGPGKADPAQPITEQNEWKDKFEEWVTNSWPEYTYESGACRGAARYAMEWIVDNVIRKQFNND